MADGEVTLAEEEALDILIALDDAHRELRRLNTDRLALVIAVEDAIALLNRRLFPDLPEAE